MNIFEKNAREYVAEHEQYQYAAPNWIDYLVTPLVRELHYALLPKYHVSFHGPTGLNNHIFIDVEDRETWETTHTLTIRSGNLDLGELCVVDLENKIPDDYPPGTIGYHNPTFGTIPFPKTLLGLIALFEPLDPTIDDYKERIARSEVEPSESLTNLLKTAEEKPDTNQGQAARRVIYRRLKRGQL